MSMFTQRILVSVLDEGEYSTTVRHTESVSQFCLLNVQFCGLFFLKVVTTDTVHGGLLCK